MARPLKGSAGIALASKLVVAAVSVLMNHGAAIWEADVSAASLDEGRREERNMEIGRVRTEPNVDE